MSRLEDKEVLGLLKAEKERQRSCLSLIASENIASKSVMAALGSEFTNKYAEGYPARRYYGGCEVHDKLENLAIDRAKELFKAEHINVQAHSGSNANIAAYFALAKYGDTILAMNLDHGGHLTHGAKVNFSGKFFNIVSYGVNKESCKLDYEEISRLAQEHKPKLIIAGASAYSRTIDFKKFHEIAKAVDAKLLVDMAHISGLVATGHHPSPVPYADIVSSTTHKTLRGPRGGILLCKEEYKKKVNSWIFPGLQGGPLMHAIAGKAVCFKEALDESFAVYQEQTLKNSKLLASCLMDEGFNVVSGGTDNHLFLVDLQNTNLTGKDAEAHLDEIGIVVNKNKLPFDEKPPMITSGIRIGTPAVTTRGMKEKEMHELADIISCCLKSKIKKVSLKERVHSLAEHFLA